jgi:HlyD family secretion protein
MPAPSPIGLQGPARNIAMKKSKLLLLALLLLVPLLFALQKLALGKAVDGVTPTRQALTETVISSGRVITPDRIAIGAELLGKVLKVPVEEGERVQAGQLLAEMDDGEQSAAVEQARRALDEATSRLEQLNQVSRPVADQNLIQAEANLAQAAAEFERVKTLAEAGFYNRSRLDEARRAVDAARAAREAAQAQARGNRPEGVETRLANARLEQARAALAVAQAKEAKTVIRAPAPGLLVRKLVEAGDTVTLGKALFELAADGETQIVLQIDEKNLGLLAVGQQASVLADAYLDRPFPAEIFYISPAVDPAKGSVEVKLRVKSPPPFVKADMTVSVEIGVGERKDALTLPSEMVRDATSAQPWLLVASDGRAERRPVKLGLRGTGRVEVVSGLKEGDIVLPPQSGVEPGDKVRARK